MLAWREFLGASNASLVRPLFRVFRPILICVGVCEHRLFIDNEQTPAPESSTLSRQHTVRSALWDLYIGCDTERLVVHIGRVSLGDADHAGVVCEIRLTAEKIWTNCWIHAVGENGVKRYYVVFDRFDQKAGLQVAKFLRVLLRDILSLAEVVGEIVEFPLVVIRIGRRA